MLDYNAEKSDPDLIRAGREYDSVWKSLCLTGVAAVLCTCCVAFAQAPKDKHATAYKHRYAAPRSAACAAGAGTYADGTCVTPAQSVHIGAAVRGATAATQTRINNNSSGIYLPSGEMGTVKGKDIFVYDQGPGGVGSAPGGAASDIRLKLDIADVGQLDNGIKLYSFRYFWSDQVYVGVMAQQVAAIVPDAVVMQPNGYLAVYYDRLGLKMQTWEQWQATHRVAAP